jgi:hypothetical protein
MSRSVADYSIPLVVRVIFAMLVKQVLLLDPIGEIRIGLFVNINQNVWRIAPQEGEVLPPIIINTSCFLMTDRE